MSNHQRLYYRPEQSPRINVELIGDDGKFVRGRVTDVYVDGVGVHLPASACLALGSCVQLGLSTTDASYSVKLHAVVRSRQDGKQFRVYELRFRSNEDLRESATQGLYSMLNRRNTQRFRLSAPLQVAVTPHGACQPVSARLSGVSETGLSLVVDRQFEMGLAESERLVLRTQEPVATRVDLVVRNRLLLDNDGIRYGSAFADDTEGNTERATDLVDALLERERTLLDAQ